MGAQGSHGQSCGCWAEGERDRAKSHITLHYRSHQSRRAEITTLCIKGVYKVGCPRRKYKADGRSSLVTAALDREMCECRIHGVENSMSRQH